MNPKCLIKTPHYLGALLESAVNDASVEPNYSWSHSLHDWEQLLHVKKTSTEQWQVTTPFISCSSAAEDMTGTS